MDGKRMKVAHLSKSYGMQVVLDDFSYEFTSSAVTCVMGNSGIGKTTLMRILLGLEKPDTGTVSNEKLRCSAVFQENRLVEQLSALANVKMVLPKRKYTDQEIQDDMVCILPKECLAQKVCALSGGMKRRIAVVRAMLAESDVVILDEPFTGLDADTKKQVQDYIIRHRANRILILVTHDEREVCYFNAVKCLLTTS